MTDAELRFHYCWAQLDDGRFGVFIAYYDGPFAGWWNLIAVFRTRERASDYVELENFSLGERWSADERHGDEIVPLAPPDEPLSALPRLVEIVGGRGRSPIDLRNRTFGSLTVLGLAEQKSGDRHRYWRCRCVCGNVLPVRSDHLLSGASKSCGCERPNHLPQRGVSP